MHYRWTEARRPQRGTKGAKAFIFCAFCPSWWLPSSFFHPAARSVSQLAGLIQLREAATSVNKKHFPSLVHHNAGVGVRNRRGRSAEETKTCHPTNGFHAHCILECLRELSEKCKINYDLASARERLAHCEGVS